MIEWKAHEREGILARSYAARGFGGLRQVTLDDGPMRGQRLLELRTAQGLEVEVALDRGFDIAALRYRGINIGWLGPSNFPTPVAVETDQDIGLLRSFEGFLVTCGLDHHGLPATGPADHFLYPHRTTVEYPLHGRIATIPAILEQRVVDLDSDMPSISCTGLVRQAVVFGEVLELRRTIHMPLLGSTLRIEDAVTNRGGTPVRHGILYHINFGYPFLDEALSVTGVDSQTVDGWASSPPRPDPKAIQTFEPITAADPAGAGVRLTNRSRGGLSLTLRYRGDQLTQLGIWQTNQSGLFALGLEPHTPLGPAERPYFEGSPDFLLPGDTRRYEISIELDAG